MEADDDDGEEYFDIPDMDCCRDSFDEAVKEHSVAASPTNRTDYNTVLVTEFWKFVVTLVLCTWWRGHSRKSITAAGVEGDTKKKKTEASYVF